MINWKVVLCLCLGSLLMFGPPSICWSEPLPQNTGDITQKIENVFKKKTPQGPAAPFQAVTTSLKDAYPIANWLDSYSQVLKPQPTSSLTLAPGYYRVTVRSYCLHAGAYAPTQGAGYLLSPLKGTQAPLITSILEKSEAHPEVAQQDVQQLIWGIEAGVKYSQYPPAFRARVAPLLSPQDITSMEEVQMLGSWLNSLTEHLPKDAQEITNYFTQLREMLVNPSMSYSQIEQYAVKTGVPPLGAGSKNYPEGQWAYARDGFYVREVGHNGYWSTTLEILRPAPFSIERDTQGRIAKLHSGNSTMELSYENQPGGQPVSVEGFPAIRTWRVASIKMLGLTSHEPTVIPASSTATMTPTSLANDWTGALQRLAEYGRVIGHPVNFQSPDSQDLADLTTLLNGLASSRPVLQASASAATLSAANESVLNAWAYAACAQLGHCVSGAQTSSAAPERLDLAGFVESPANTSMQRLGQGGTGNAPAELAVTGFWLTVPLDSVTILLTKSASTSPPYHGITSNSTQKCTTLTFNNQDTGGNDASANASFTINVTVLNQSTRNLAPPTLQAVPNPATDVAGRRPTWVANLVPPVTEIAPGQTTTLTYQVTASWASFTQPDQLTQSLEHIGTETPVTLWMP